MKKSINKLLYILVALVLVVSSCDWSPVVWDESKVFVAFSDVSTSILEEGGTIGIVVAVTALDGAPAVTVDFEFDTTGIDAANAALEGDQYTLLNDSKTLSFPNGWGWDTIWIEPADNEIFTGDKEFNITLTTNSLDLTLGAISTHAVVLKDNEHPLAKWLGDYSVEALSYGNPGPWDEAWSVSAAPDPDNVSNLLLSISVYYPGEPFAAKIDTEAMTITIEPGTDAGDLYGGGPVTFYSGDYGTQDMEAPIVGTIEEDGTIRIDNLASFHGDEIWDAFNTTWTKSAKKSLSASSVNQEKASKLK